MSPTRRARRWSLLALIALGAIPLGCGGGDDGTANDGGSSGQGGTHHQGGSGGINLGGSGAGSGANAGSGASAGAAGNGGATCGQVTGKARDFQSSHPDFQCTVDSTQAKFTDPYNKDCGPWDPAIVGPLGSPLGSDDKPVYAGGNGTPSTTGKANFDQWYRDVAGVNLSALISLLLTQSASGTLVYDTSFFFPLDGQLFDAQPNNPDTGKFLSDDMKARNFHFTYELHTTFRYQAGNVFTFRGDDDVFVYIDHKLAVNLGGIHVPLQAKLNLDSGRVEVTAPMGIPALDVQPTLGFSESIQGGVAGTQALNLVPGQIYAMDFFFAERNCCASNFRLETNFDFVDCGTVK